MYPSVHPLFCIYVYILIPSIYYTATMAQQSSTSSTSNIPQWSGGQNSSGRSSQGSSRSNGSFEVITPPSTSIFGSNVSATSSKPPRDFTLEQAVDRVNILSLENADLRGLFELALMLFYMYFSNLNYRYLTSKMCNKMLVHEWYICFSACDILDSNCFLNHTIMLDHKKSFWVSEKSQFKNIGLSWLGF